jgi:hypothetical protein
LIADRDEGEPVAAHADRHSNKGGTKYFFAFTLKAYSPVARLNVTNLTGLPPGRKINNSLTKVSAKCHIRSLAERRATVRADSPNSS